MYEQPKLVMRQNSYADFYQAVQVAVDRVIKQPQTMPYQNCLNCTKWNYGKDICGLYNAKPPTEILIYSCSSYEDSGDIPF